jgi:hypothetical protein
VDSLVEVVPTQKVAAVEQEKQDLAFQTTLPLLGVEMVWYILLLEQPHTTPVAVAAVVEEMVILQTLQTQLVDSVAEVEADHLQTQTE